MLSLEEMNDLKQGQEFDPEVLGGSMKLGIVNPALAEERAKCNFDLDEAYKVLYTEDLRYEFNLYHALVKKHPEIHSTTRFYEMTREEKFKEWWERLRIIMADEEFRHMINHNSFKKCKYFNWFYQFAGNNPLALHMQMFTMAVL